LPKEFCVNACNLAPRDGELAEPGLCDDDEIAIDVDDRRCDPIGNNCVLLRLFHGARRPLTYDT